MWQPLEILNVFKYFNLEADLLENKTKTFFKKVESIKFENASFPYKTTISEANVKTNKKVSTKWTYHKERSFAGNYFIFLKILF